MNITIIILLSLLSFNCLSQEMADCYEKKDRSEAEFENCLEELRLTENMNFKETQEYIDNPDSYDDISYQNSHALCLSQTPNQSDCNPDLYRRKEDGLPIYDEEEAQSFQ